MTKLSEKNKIKPVKFLLRVKSYSPVLSGRCDIKVVSSLSRLYSFSDVENSGVPVKTI